MADPKPSTVLRHDPDSSTSSQADSLWRQAVQRLSDADRRVISVERPDRRAVLDDLITLVVQSAQKCSDRQWRYRKSNGEVVTIRETLAKVVHWIQKFKEVGDIVVQYDPTHTALPWAGVRLLLQISINDAETYGAMADGLELVTRLIVQYAKVEDLYFPGQSGLEAQLEDAVLHLYVAIMTYVVRAKAYYERNSAARLGRSIVQGSSAVDKYIAPIKDKASVANELARLIDADRQHELSVFMSTGLSGLTQKLNMVDDNLVSGLRGLELHMDTLEGNMLAAMRGLQPVLESSVGREDLLEWLDAVFTDQEWETARDMRTSDTCAWIFETHEYQEWESHSKSTSMTKLLWVHGPPGFGKTVLCANVIRVLQSQLDANVAHFFCVADDIQKRQPYAIMRSWVAQMVRQVPEAVELAREVHFGKEGRKATISDIEHLFEKIGQRLSHGFFVVDGYDECLRGDPHSSASLLNQSQQFLSQLMKIVKNSSCHVLLVSRDSADVRSHLQRSTENVEAEFWEYKVSETDTRRDLQTFTTSLIASSLPKKGAELKEELVQTTTRRSEGMFLWVRLLGQRLDPAKNAKRLRSIVQEMPAGLGNTYESELRRISMLSDTDDRHRAIAILRWTLLAQRPLTLRELIECLVIDVEEDSREYPREDLPDDWQDEAVYDEVQKLCGSLVEFRKRDPDTLPEARTVHFVHASVKEYLLTANLLGDTPEAGINLTNSESEHNLLARICLQYLMYDEMVANERPTEQLTRQRFSDYGFFQYAADFWYQHVRNGTQRSPELSDMVDEFFQLDQCKWLSWSRAFDLANGADVPPPRFSEFTEHKTLLAYYVSCLGLVPILEQLWHSVEDDGGSKSLSIGALYGAAGFGHVEAVQFLINAGAKIEGNWVTGSEALMIAAAKGRTRVVKMLLDNQARVSAPDLSG